MGDEPELKITYNRKVELSCPPNIKWVTVKIEAKPKDGRYIIYGWDADGQLLPIELSGSHAEYDLPFARNEIYIKYLHGLKSFQLSVVGVEMIR